MAMFLLDTSVLIDAINQKRDRPQVLRELLRRGHTLACCPINVTEVYAGMRPNEESRTKEFLQSLQYCPITWPVARLAGLLKRDYSRKGIALATTDASIAAVALYHHYTLVADNLKDYPMKDWISIPSPRRRSPRSKRGIKRDDERQHVLMSPSTATEEFPHLRRWQQALAKAKRGL